MRLFLVLAALWAGLLSAAAQERLGPTRLGLGSTGDGFPSVAALRAWTGTRAAGMDVRTAGYGAPGDGGAGRFVWSAASTATDDGCTVVKPTAVSGAGRWLRSLDNGAILPAAACGASAASNDNTAALTAAFAACKGRGVEGKPVCAVELPAGDIKHTGLTIDRGLQLRSNPRGSTLLAKAGITVPGMTIACAHDGFDYYANGAPPCKVDLTSIILKHENKNDVPGRNIAHGLVIKSAVTNTAYTIVTADNLEIYSAPGDGLNTAGWSNGYAVINRLYISNAYRDGLSLTGAYDWRLYAVDLIYSGRDNALFSSSGGLNIYGLKTYTAARYNLNIFDTPGAPGVNYIFGLAADNSGQHNIHYDSRDPFSAWGIYGGNTDRAGSFPSPGTPNTYSDLYVAATANSRLTFGGNFRFNAGYATASGQGQTSKLAIEFDPASAATVRVDDSVFQGGNPTTANGWSNKPAQTLGKGGRIVFNGGITATGANPGVRVDDAIDNTQFVVISLNNGQTALYDSRLNRNIAVWDGNGALVTSGIGAQNFPSSPSGLPSGSVYRDPGTLTLKYVP